MGSRSPIAATATAVAVLATAMTVAAPDPADGAPKRLAPGAQSGSVELVECSQGRRRRDRWAVFRGEMAQVRGGERMRMRFVLFERFGGGAWTPVRAPGLGVWRESRPGVTRFAYSQRVVGLERATAYRAEVAFRWHDAEGRRIAAGDARSRVCRQRGRLANLLVRDAVAVHPGPTPETALYVARVANDGRAGARAVRVLLRVDGVDLDVRTIAWIGAGRQRVARFVGPRCLATVEVRADPGNAIRETSEDDNVASAVCPVVD